MSANEAIVLKAAFDDWKKRTAGIPVDPWLYFSVEQFVKPFSFSDEEILHGITDGGDDGGADAIFFIANEGLLVKDADDLDPKLVNKLRLIFFQVKTSGGFKHTQIERFISLASHFFDLSQDAKIFAQIYNEKVIDVMDTFKRTYVKVAGNSELTIEYFYVTQDDATTDPHSETSAKEVKKQTLALMSKAHCFFRFAGASAIWEEVQKRPPKTRMLTWLGTPMSSVEGVVGLVRLSDYKEFLQDAPGVLAERIFESNVRGYQQDATVNEEIRASLEKKGKANFWLLNNGVTIIAAKATPTGHLRVSIEDAQIVNGLQTSREIFNFHNSGKMQPDEDRSLLVRVIETSDPEVSDLVIRATNSQNRMAAARCA
jgi:hypothetical protein